MKKIITILVVIMMLTSCQGRKNKTENPQTDNHQKENQEEVVVQKDPVNVSFSAVGDNLIHGTIYKDALRKGNNKKYDFTSVYTKIKPIISKYDVSFINQETILGGTEIGLSGYPMFNSPQEVGLALVDAGFDLINQASNHSLDKGKKGIENTVNFWNSQPVLMNGVYNSSEDYEKLRIMEVKGVKIAYLTYTSTTNGIPVPKDEPYRISLLSKEKVKQDVTRAKEVADLVFVNLHFGTEYSFKPNEMQKDYAKYLNELGVDFVIGQHPHVIQPMEIIKNEETGFETLVAYSLGNFVSAQVDKENLFGLMVNFEVEYDFNTRTKKFNYIDVLPMITHYDNYFVNFKVYPINEYTYELSKKHGVNNYKGYYEMDLKYIKNKVKEVIDSQFNIILE